MNLKWKNAWPVLSATLIAFTCVLNADAPDTGMNNPTPDEQTMGSNDMNAPSTRPDLKSPSGWSLEAAALWWNAHEDGLAPALNNNNGIVAAETNASRFTNSNAENLHFKWKWGFKLGAFYNLAHDNWDFGARWTYFRDTASKTLQANDALLAPSNTLWAVWSAFNTLNTGNPTAVGVDAHWRLRLNIVDAEMGRKFFAGKWLTIRPHAGLRSAWINQKYDIQYAGGTFETGGTTAVVDDISMKNNFWGFGVRCGMDSQWNLGGGWSFFGDWALSVLYGRFKIHQNEVLGPVQITNPSNTLLNVVDSYRVSRAITDLDLGLRWEQGFRDSAFHVTVSLGWEHHMFFDQNMLSRYNTVSGPAQATGYTTFTPAEGDLSTQGWTLDVKFDF